MKKIILILLSITTFAHASVPAGLVKITSGIFANGGQIRDLKIDANGKIVACGYTLVGGQTRWTVARFTSIGFLDTTFNGTGYVQYSENGSRAECLAIQSNGQIIVGGMRFTPVTPDAPVPCLARYNQDGTVSTDLTTIYSVSGTTTSVVGLCLDNTETYICAIAPQANPFSDYRYFVYRINNDSSFSGSSTFQVTITRPGVPGADLTSLVGTATTTPNNNVILGSAGVASVLNTRAASSASIPTNVTVANSSIHRAVALDNSNFFYSMWSGNNCSIYKTNASLAAQATYTVTANNKNSSPYNQGGGIALTTGNTTITTCGCSTASSASGQPFVARLLVSDGSLDGTFGTSGITIQTESSVTPGYFGSLAVSSGKVVVGGFTSSDGTDMWLIGRYDTNGALDTTFTGVNLTGLLRDTASPFSTTTAGLILTTTIDQSGKLLAGGNSGTASALIRYNTTGSPRDTSFSDDGVALGDLAATATINKVINQAGTDYLVAGISGSQQFTTAKYQVSDGSLNTAYGTGGIVQETVGAAGISAAYDMLLNGTALGVCGYAYTNTPIVINYHSGTGERDTSIGRNGTQEFAYLGNGTIYGITAPTGGSRYGAGQGTNSNIAFLRLLANGTGMLQDTASPFDTGLAGLITTTTIDQGGKLLAGGNYGTAAELIRYNVTGSPRDTSFNTTGVGASSFTATATINKVINSGTGYLVAGIGGSGQFSTALYANGGTLNATYGGTGIVQESGVGPSAAYDMLLSGETLGVCGYAYSTTPILINYTSSTGARASIQEFPAIGDGTMYGITAIGANRYGAGQGVSSNTAFLRLLMDGTGLLQDTAAPFSESGNGIVYGECIDALGNITLCGSYNNTWMIVKYSNTAARVTSFNGDGVVLDSSLGVATAKALIQDANGNYYVAGESTVNGTTVLTVAKYSNVGELVSSFGTNGIVQLTNYGQSRATNLVLTADNKLLVTGQVTVNGTLYAALVAYDQSGTLIPTFGTNGVQIYQDLGTGIVNTVVSNQETDTATAGGQTTNQATLLQVAQTSPAAAVIASGM